MSFKYLNQSFQILNLQVIKQKLVVSDESGILTMLNSKTFEIIKTFKNQNLDNVFKLI